MFKFSQPLRMVIYTINAIASLNRARSVFPSGQSLLKALYLTTYQLTKKWTMPLRNWGAVYSKLAVMFLGRFSGS